jgi:hypothetical protein
MATRTNFLRTMAHTQAHDLRLSQLSLALRVAWLSGMAIFSLPAFAQSQQKLQAPNEDVRSIKFDRFAPAGFAAAVEGGVDHALKYKKTVHRDIVFVKASGSDQEFILATLSMRPLQNLLLGLGLHEPAVEQLVRKVRWQLGQEECLALQDQPQNCVRLRLVAMDKPGAQAVSSSSGAAAAFEIVELQIDDSNAQLRTETVANDLTLSGGSYLYAGSSKSSQAYGLGTWGIVSAGAKRAEYDLGFTHSTAQQTLASPTRARLNTLIVGAPVAGGTGFAGLHRAASGGQAFGAGGASNFLSRPAQWGVAWQSDDSKLSDARLKRSVQLILSSPSFVRILSDGYELFQGQLAAGEQKIEFSGYAGAFVDAEIRPASGQIVTRRLEVSRVQPQEGEAIRAKTDTSFWYADVGKVVSARPNASHNLGQTDVIQASLAYSYLAPSHVGQLAVQSVNNHLRMGVSLTDRDRRMSGSALLGAQGEKGLNGSWQLPMGIWQGSFGFTEYRPPSEGGRVSGKCIEGQESFCFSSNVSGYSSRNLGLGIKDLPVRLSANWSRFGDEWTRQTNLSYNQSLRSFWRGAFATVNVQHSSRTSGFGLYASLTAPLESSSGGAAYVRGSIGGQSGGGGASYSLAYSETMPQDSEGLKLISSYSLSLQGGLGSASSGNPAVYSANVESRLGVFQNTSNITHSAQGGTSFNTAFATSYGVSKEGIAFNLTDSRGSSVGSMSSSGQASVVVHNRSQEVQFVIVNGRDNEIPPQSNVMIPVQAGYIEDIRVHPGPVLNMNASMDGQMLYKGNLKKVIVPEGFWVLARFKDAAAPRSSKAFLDVEFTFKRPGEAVERVYPSSNGEVSLFEFKENGEEIVRYVSVKGGTQEYRCAAKAADMPKPGGLLGYAEMEYLCTLIPGGVRKASTETDTPQSKKPLEGLTNSRADEPLKPSASVPKGSQPEVEAGTPKQDKPNATSTRPDSEKALDTVSLRIQFKKWLDEVQNNALTRVGDQKHPSHTGQKVLELAEKPMVLTVRDVQMYFTNSGEAEVSFLALTRVGESVEWRRNFQNWRKSNDTWEMRSPT